MPHVRTQSQQGKSFDLESSFSSERELVWRQQVDLRLDVDRLREV